MTKLRVQPYLNFDGRCEEAVEFYRTALGAEVLTLMRMKDNPEPCPPESMPEGTGEKVMHASFKIGETIVMASDCACTGVTNNFKGFSLSITVPDEATADRLFAALAEGGEIEMPLEKTFWSPRFGVVADRFGVSWMINLEP